MSAAVTVRPATPSDVPTILSLIEELAVYEKLRHECFATTELLQTHLFGARPAAEVLMAEADGQTLGFALFYTSFSTWLARPCLFLEDLYVRPSQRKLGAGRALLTALATIGLERNCGRIQWHVLTWNQLAIDFYDRIGANDLEGWKIYRMDESGMQLLTGAAR